MKITGYRNTYADADLNTADTDYYDLVQYKYDGMFIVVIIDGLSCELYTRSGRLYDRVILEMPQPKTVFVGELLRGTQRSKHLRGNKIMGFDVQHAWGEDVSRRNYLQRMDALDFSTLPVEFLEHYEVERVATSNAKDGITDHWSLVQLANLEGLILRPSKDRFGQTICRIKQTIERDYYATKINYNRNGVAMSIGGSLTKGGPEVVRARLFGRADYTDFEAGRCFVVTGQEVTEAGSIRHPKFSRWHHEK